MALPLNTKNVTEALSPVIQPFRVAGRIGRLSGRALVNVPASLRYRSVIANHISDVAVGSGAYIVGAGAIIVIVVMTAVVGIQTSLEGTKGLELIGAQDLVGFVSAYASIREIAPLIAGVIFAAQLGAQFTAELGAMRISNEIDALEVMGLPSMRYLVSTRLIASMIVVLPLYVIGLYIMLLTTKFTSVAIFHVPSGTYSEYFNLYLQRLDVFYSVVKIMVFITLVTLIHCTYGFYASGGPEGVGQAVGRSVRLSVTLIFLVNFVLSMMFWGGASSIRFSG
ncbi:MAG: ABC transporter permease [Acidimicrobiia bacterium]|nr:ABC transporter permease [Acidimicrobiia bacterium]